MRPKIIRYYEKHNPEEVNNVDFALQLFDGWNNELYTKLRNTHGSSHGLHDIALAGDNTNKLAMTNRLFPVFVIKNS